MSKAEAYTIPEMSLEKAREIDAKRRKDPNHISNMKVKFRAKLKWDHSQKKRVHDPDYKGYRVVLENKDSGEIPSKVRLGIKSLSGVFGAFGDFEPAYTQKQRENRLFTNEKFAKKDATKAQQQFFLQSLDENGEPELDGLDDSFAEQIIKHAQAQAEKDGTEELLFEMDPVLLKLFDSAESVKEYPKFFKLVRKDESRGTSSFKFKKHTCRRTFDKGDPEFVIAKQSNIKNPSTNQSSYENLIKGQNKTVWPMSINAFVEVNVQGARAGDKRRSDDEDSDNGNGSPSKKMRNGNGLSSAVVDTDDSDIEEEEEEEKAPEPEPVKKTAKKLVHLPTCGASGNATQFTHNNNLLTELGCDGSAYVDVELPNTEKDSIVGQVDVSFTNLKLPVMGLTIIGRAPRMEDGTASAAYANELASLCDY